jgi:SAM-dependent methyltransferase
VAPVNVDTQVQDVVRAPDSYASIATERQRAYLRRLIRTSFPDRRPVQHDIGCGTGQVVRLLHGMVREAHGYDTSPSKLAAARAAGLRAHWHEIGADGPVPQPVRTDGPAVVTVFRLPHEAPDEGRDRMLRLAARALPSHISGLLIVANRDDPDLPHARVAELLRRHGFTVVERHGSMMFRAGAYRWRPLRWLVRRLDTLLCRFDSLSGHAADVLYVARRNPVAPRPHRPTRG